MATEGSGDSPIVLCRVGSYMQASMIQQIFEDEGILSRTDGENANAVFGVMTSGVAQVSILVRQRDRYRAIEILADVLAQTNQKIWVNALSSEPQCPDCGYILYYAQDQRCPECGKPFQFRDVCTDAAQVLDGVLLPKGIQTRSAESTKTRPDGETP